MTKKYKATEEQFRKALLKWLGNKVDQLRANVHGDDDTSEWCKDEADLVEQHIQTVESLIFVNEALKVSADEAHRQADLAYERIEELEEQLRWVLDERDATFALMLNRAETAEAKLANVIAAYRLEAMKRDDYSHDAFDKHIAELTGGKDE